MILDRRTCATGVLLFAAGLAVTVSMARAVRPELKSEVVTVRKEPGGSGQGLRERLASLDATLLEDYETFALVSLGPGARRALEREGLEIDAMPDRTLAGRGAYRFDTRLGEPRLPDDLSVDPLKDQAYDVYIVQLIGPVKSSWLEALRGAGAETLLYLPSFSYVTAIEPRDRERVEKLGFVQWVGVYQPAYKLDPGLLGGGAGPETITLSLLPGRDSKRAESTVAASGGSVTNEWTLAGQRYLLVTIDRSSLPGLARLPEIFSMERFVVPSLVNDQATWVTQSNVSGNRSIHAKGLHGEGQLVTMSDEGVYAQHPMFNDSQPFGNNHRKIQACDHIAGCPGGDPGCSDLGALIGHGTHVAGVIAGDAPSGTTYGTYNDHDGHAFMSRLVIQDLGPMAECLTHVDTDIVGILYQPSFNLASRIHSNSWGSQSTLSYCAGAVGGDQFMWDNPDYLIVFAAGNEGNNPLAIRCEATAKDIITVGATLNGSLASQRWSSSSRGPTGNDSRRKPTVMAPGVDICSANDINHSGGGSCVTPPITSDYSTMTGTSFAAPAVAGNVALARQYFMEGWYPSGSKIAAQAFTPSAAQLKAVIVNGAQEMNGAGAYSDSTVKIVSGALAMTRGQNSIDPASAVSTQITLDYSQPYTLNISLLVPGSVTLGQMSVFDDGRVRAEVSPGTGSKFTLTVFGGNGSGQAQYSRGAWHQLIVTYTPSLGTFQATVDDLPIGGALTFRSIPTHQIAAGADTSAANYGSVSVDDICYFGDNTWCDSFTDLSNWTITPAHDDTGYPNNLQGWGRINMDNSLFFAGDALKLVTCDDRAGLRTGQSRSTTVQVTDTSKPLEATLVWSDRPGADPQHAITNDLNLVVRSPSNVVYRGNCFTGRNPGQSTSDPACLADSVNVEEDVLRLNPVESGLWTIEVDAQNVDPSNGDKPQPFGLAVTGGIVEPAQTATSDYQTSPGTIVAGTFQSTWISDNNREGFQETLNGGVYSLTQIWKFQNVTCPPSHVLHLEGYRVGNSSHDTFQFAWAPDVNGVPGTFTDIPAAIISQTKETTGGTDYPFVGADLTGTVYIRVKDLQTGSAQTTLYIDHLTVR